MERVESPVRVPPKPTSVESKAAVDLTENYFCSVRLGRESMKVILFTTSEDLGSNLLHRCRAAQYDCCVLDSVSAVEQQLLQLRCQAVVVVETLDPAHLSRISQLNSHISANNLASLVTVAAVVPHISSSGPVTALIDNLLASGISRMWTVADCSGERMMCELRMITSNDVRLREKLVFGHALFEAVEQCNDAIQITDRNSQILYVNRSFVDLSGYSRDEVLGKPAVDILRTFDTKAENGPKNLAVKKSQGWDGVCMGRRKSGSVLKQHIKLIPVVTSADHVYHHVTIQRLLSANDPDHHPRLTSPKFPPHGSEAPFTKMKQSSSGTLHHGPRLSARLETPITKAVSILAVARDSEECPVDVREALERGMDILCSSELYAPISSSGTARGEDPRTYRGIVAGLLQSGQSGRRFSLSGMDMTTMHMRMSYPYHSARNPPISIPPPEVQQALTKIDLWEFDIIGFEELSHNEPLYYIGMRIFKDFGISDVLRVDDTMLAVWLKLMESHYHQRNAYHNSTHAADVLQSTAYFIKLLQDHLVSQGEILEPIEVAALLISAVIHDLDHPARTNPYMCNSRDELALLYNDSAVLENHHVALSFKLTQHSKDVNIFQNLDNAMYRSLRSSIIDLVLATDMAKHFEHLSKFTVVDGESGSTTSLTAMNRETKMVMKRILVKCADISNPCRPQKMCKAWAGRIAEEYFSQTEDEKEQNFPVVFPDFDRQTCNIPVTQVKFIDYFILGLFEAWHNFCDISVVMEYQGANYSYWKSICPESPTTSEEEEDDSSTAAVDFTSS